VGDASGRGAAWIYAREVVVVFVSADYAAGDWTRLECHAAFSRAAAAPGVCVLPVRFDDRELPGLLPDVVAVDPRRYTPAQFADLVVAKLADLAISPAPSGAGRRAGAGGGGRPAAARHACGDQRCAHRACFLADF
jgi:hypothetical protein